MYFSLSPAEVLGGAHGGSSGLRTRPGSAQGDRMLPQPGDSGQVLGTFIWQQGTHGTGPQPGGMRSNKRDHARTTGTTMPRVNALPPP